MTAPVRSGASSVTPTQVIRQGLSDLADKASAWAIAYQIEDMAAINEAYRAALAALAELEKQLGGEQSSPVEEEGTKAIREALQDASGPGDARYLYPEAWAAIAELEAENERLQRVADRETSHADYSHERLRAAEASLVAHRAALELAAERACVNCYVTKQWQAKCPCYSRRSRAALAVVGREEERQDLGGDQRSPVVEEGQA